MDAKATGHPMMPAEAVEQHGPARPRTLFFGVMAGAWIFPSLGALWIIGSDWGRWFGAESVSQALGRIRFEEWIALALLMLHGVLVVAAIYYYAHEKPRGIADRAEAPVRL